MKTFFFGLISIIAVVGCLMAFPRKDISTPQQKGSSVQTEKVQARQNTEKLTRKDKNCSCCKKLSHRDKILQRARQAQERRRKLAEQKFSQIGMSGANTVTPVSKN